jgi:hypothetical protein
VPIVSRKCGSEKIGYPSPSDTEPHYQKYGDVNCTAAKT